MVRIVADHRRRSHIAEGNTHHVNVTIHIGIYMEITFSHVVKHEFINLHKDTVKWPFAEPWISSDERLW
jgi:hypothetical protein